MAKNIHTVGDLRKLLAKFTDTTPIGVQPIPDRIGYTHAILGLTGRAGDLGVFLGLAEEALHDDEIEVEWKDLDGNVQRPISP